MEYNIQYLDLSVINRSHLISVKDAISIYNCYWFTINKSLSSDSHVSVLKDELKTLIQNMPPLYVKTNLAYFPKITKTFLNSITPEIYNRNKLLILPPLNQCTQESIMKINQILRADDNTPNLDNTAPPMSLSSILVLPLKNGCLKKKLQSGKSVMRRTILTPKVPAYRIQIMGDVNLRGDQAILPRSFMKHLHIKTLKRIDPFNATSDDYKTAFIMLNDDTTLISKRDPVLSVGSIANVRYVAFSDRDLFFIPTCIMSLMNADVDGDALGVFPIEGKDNVVEVTLNLAAENNMIIPNNTTRLTFSQYTPMYLHNRPYPRTDDYYSKYAKLYDFVYKDTMEAAKKDTVFVDGFRALQEYITDLGDEFFEPTLKIYQNLLLAICNVYGDSEGFNFINKLNQDIVNLSRGIRNCWYDPNLPIIYGLYDTLDSKTLARIVLSGAKGTPEHLLSLLKKKKNLDDNLSLSVSKNHCKNRIDYTELLNVIKQMAISSMSVSKNGYNSYKNFVDWSGLQVYNNHLYYYDMDLGSIEYFFASPFLLNKTLVKIFMGLD